MNCNLKFKHGFASEGTLYLITEEGRLYEQCFNPSTREEEWELIDWRVKEK